MGAETERKREREEEERDAIEDLGQRNDEERKRTGETQEERLTERCVKGRVKREKEKEREREKWREVEKGDKAVARRTESRGKEGT